MMPDDVKSFIRKLEQFGLLFLSDNKSVDIAIVDQLRGPTTKCDWLEFGHVNLSEGDQKVAVCRLVGSEVMQVVSPPDWNYESSLSATYGFVPTEFKEKGLKYLRHEDGLDVYLNPATGEEVGGKNGDLFFHIPEIKKPIEAASDHAALWIEIP